MSEKTSLTSPRLQPSDELPDPRRTLDMLATATMLALTVGTLYLAREILVPVAIAVLLSFVLSPLIKVLRKLGLGKRLSVGLVVFITFVIAVALGVVLARQMTDLAAKAPRYQSTVMQKVNSVRALAADNPLVTKLDRAVTDFAQLTSGTRKLAPPDKSAASPPRQPSLGGGGATKAAPVPVEVIPPPPDVVTVLRAAAGAAASPLATAAFVAIFVVFILMQREDLRNRLIRLFGSSDLQRTTLAMNDAAKRLSRYFLAQVLLNFGFGAVVAAVLSVLGVPSAMLWGIVAAFMRFIPYVGSFGAAVFPVFMAAASEPGWSLALETAGFFFFFELIVGQLVEPLVYGHHTGLSPIAVVISATFWTWLWGPVGLVLATPITVCVVVLGHHVDRLQFLDVLLGDTPVLSDAELFYQRMLAGDPSEILDHAETFLQEHSLLEYSDAIAMKALLMAQDDVRRGALEDFRQVRIRRTMRDFAEVLADRDEITGREASDPAASTDGDQGPRRIPAAWAKPNAVMCFAGRTPLDEAAAHLLADLLAEHGIGARVEPADSLTGEGAFAQAEARGAQLLVLSFLDADLSLAQARFAVRRLRRRVPDVPLLAAFWMSEPDEGRMAGLRDSVRAEHCASGLPQALEFCLERAAPSGQPDEGRPITASGNHARHTAEV